MYVFILLKEKKNLQKTYVAYTVELPIYSTFQGSSFQGSFQAGSFYFFLVFLANFLCT